MIRTVCAICKNNKKVKKLFPATFKGEKLQSDIYSARRFPDNIHYQIVRCERCGLIFSSPVLPQEKIASFYRESACNYNDQIRYLVKTYMGLFEQAEKFLPRNPKVLEIGCGNGFFLQALWKKGIRNVAGVEPSPKMVQEAPKQIKKSIIQDIFKPRQFKKDTFDFVACFHTLDHMLDPNDAISEIHRILKPGGVALIVVHDTDGLSVKFFGEKSPIFDIEHIYLFNKKTLSRIFEKHGFETKDISGVQNTYPLWYWWRMSGIAKILKITGLWVLELTRMGNIELTLAGGNISILARKGS